MTETTQTGYWISVSDETAQNGRVQSRLLIGVDTLTTSKRAICVESPAPMPNAWHRIWYHILLGWVWEPVRAAMENQKEVL